MLCTISTVETRNRKYSAIIDNQSCVAAVILMRLCSCSNKNNAASALDYCLKMWSYSDMEISIEMFDKSSAWHCMIINFYKMIKLDVPESFQFHF
jgi:hypothetical protein